MGTIAIAVSVYGAMQSAVGVWILTSILRAPKLSTEEQQRADMRSLSWPTK